ncbi:SPASM domain-containing protein [Aquimarina sp. 433]
MKSSVVMDLDRGSYTEIPNLLCDILLLDLKKHNIQSILDLYENQYDEGILGYLDFLVENQYGFFTKNPKPFKNPEDVFYSPYKVISSVIALGASSDYDLRKVVADLDLLSCQILQIRVYEYIDFDVFLKSLEPLKESTIRIVEIYWPDTSKVSEDDLKRLANEYANVVLVIHSSEENRNIKISEKSDKKIAFSKKKITPDTKEVYDKDLFVVSYFMYYESRHYNSGLNRKICIDTDGSIKNYLSHDKIFGNIKNEAIQDILNLTKFKEKFTITNDQIEKCKDCQFRYMCLSNSDIFQKNNKYFKEHYCDFDLV